MKILRSWDTIKADPLLHGGAVTIGNFDGVHMGHEQVLAETRGHALAVSGPAIAVTFEPHPRAVLFPCEAPRRLCHLHERLELLAAAGLDAVLLLHFTRELSQWSASDFVNRLHQSLHFRHIHVGYDFAFGHHRAGHADELRGMGESESMHFTVSEAAALEMHDAVVSSSRIRSAIEAADFPLTSDLLGRPYSISGHVGKGDQRGRKLGFPTANIDVKDLAHPPAGIYAVHAFCGERRWNGAAYLGYRPTFAGRALILETHVFDDTPDLYRKRLKVEFVRRIREDRAFTGPDDLSLQIARDCSAAKKILGTD
ncbi:MAG: riboflavin biosynthesis protein RibF [Zetaproteobacteria bacterium CG2_30_59_37]|nr:MAG: riboflavin biosynthesis protein RibF [Zetaproteobacteria bacterium CG2_30_59_37]